MTVATPEFVYLQGLVMERSAIVLSDDKQYLIEARLLPIVKELGFGSVDQLIDRASKTRDRTLEDRLVDAMTTNETLWLRDVHPFNALKRTILPSLIERKGTTHQLSVWSAASSSGQEIFSFALILEEDFPNWGAGGWTCWAPT